jgi:hypothetical protein
MFLHDFNIRHPELEGFSDYYAKEVFPFLEEREGLRRSAIRKTFIGSGIFAVIAVAVIAFIIQKDGVSFPAFLYPVMGFFAASFGTFAWLTNKVRTATKDKIVGDICAYVGWTFTAKVLQNPDLTDWRILGLLPKDRIFKNTRISFEDQISGAAHGAEFQSTEIHIERKSDKKWVTVMRGQAMSITFPRKFLGKTAVLRDKKIFQSKKRGDMKRVGLVDPVFEKIFEAYGTDQVEARYLLTPTFMQRLVDLEKSVSGKNIRFGFIGGRLLIVVETPNQFEAGNMFLPLTRPDRTQKILDEIAAVYDVVDGVMKPRKAS